MVEMTKLTDKEIHENLSKLDGWRLEGGSIAKDFQFKDFATALDFMNRVGVIADKELNHHPDWSNSYNRVSIKLTTHSAGGLSELDFKLAEAADAIASGL